MSLHRCSGSGDTDLSIVPDTTVTEKSLLLVALYWPGFLPAAAQRGSCTVV